jgi:uncharacterized protein YfaS (alpha-2-macroglobulin family)
LLTSALVVAVALSCHETITLPPVKGPPITIPEHRGTSPVELASRPLEIIHVSPQGQLDSPHAQIAISFNKPMVSLEKVEDRAAKQPLTIKPAVPGKQRWLGSRTLMFEPEKPLPGSTEFTLSIQKGVRALDGSELEHAKTWSFITPRIAVSRVYPAPGARWVTPDAKVELYLNQPVKPSVLEKHAFFLAATDGGKARPYTITAKAKRGKSKKHLVLHPNTAFPKDARITLQLAKELTGAEGPLPMDKTYASSFRTYGPFRVIGLTCTEGCDPDYSVRLSFSNPVRLKEARKVIRVNGRPLRAGSSNYFTSSVYLEGRRRPRARYTVTVGQVKDRFGQKLERPKKPLSFKTGDYDPMVHFPLERAGVLEANAPKRLPIYFRNASSARLLSKRLTEAEVAAFLDKDQWGEELHLPGFPGHKDQKVKAAGRPNARVVRRVDLGRLLDGKRRGIVALELETKLRRNGKLEEEYSRSVVRVTDLAVNAKYSPHTTMVWVTSLSRGRPVKGCEVAIWRPGGKRALWRGRTESSGLAVGPGVNNLGGGDESRRFIFFVKNGDDQSYVLSGTQSGISPWDFGMSGTWEDPASSLLGMIFSDRGIYRPGERVHVKGIFRRTGPARLVTPGGMKVELTINDSRGEKLKSLERRTGEFGSLDFELELPPGASLGSYSVVGKAEGGGTIYGSFRVEEYRPAEFKVEVRPARSEYTRGDTMAWTSSGTYLFGAAMRGAKARWYVHQSRSYFQPPKHEGFVFSDEVRWWGDERSSTVPFVAKGTAKLDDRGQMAKTVPLKPPRMQGPMSYEIETTVTDVSRQTVSNRASVLLHPGEFYVGAKPRETFLKAGASLEAALVAATPRGERLTGKRIAGSLYRRTWHSVRKKGMGGSHYFVTRPRDTKVGECAVVSAAKPQPCKIKVAKAGYYFLRLSGQDGRSNPLSASFGLYVAGPDYVPWRRDNESKVELVTDRKKYKIGQTARILIKSPFANAHGLFTVERSGILTRKPIKLKGTSQWMEVPITRDLVPDAYVSVVLVRGRVPGVRKRKDDEEDPGKPTFKVGYSKLAISNADNRLRVSVKPAQKEYRPGQQAAVEFVVKDRRGRPAKAELTVIVADEGVLSLIGYRTPDPMSIFYADRGLSVRTADNRIRLISRRVFGEKGKNPGGGGGGEGESGSGGVRRNFVSTPFFNPSVVTDDKGHARVDFKLPDNLTTFRIMAVATSAAAEFGNGQSQVKVNKPLLLLPALPRLVRVGDRIEAGVVVHNHSGKSGQVRVTADVEGVKLTGVGMQSVSVKDGGSAEARFTISAYSPGEAVLRFSARLEDHRDALELRKPVKLAMVTETVATHGSTTSAVAEGMVPSKGIRHDVGGLEVAMSSSALVGMKGGVEYLLDYPYECLEQTTSRMVPLVLLRDLSKAYGLEAAKPAETKALVSKLVARIQKLQRWSGGFSFWPSTHHTSPWVSAYAAWGLAKAKTQGFKVSDRVLQRAKEFLKNQLKRKTPKDPDAAALDLDTKAYLVYVMTELGDKPAAYVNNLYERRKDLAVFARALLLSSVARLRLKGSVNMIDKLVAELANHIHQTPRLAKVEENLGDGYAPLFHSNVRSTAMALQALLDAQPEHPLVEKLTAYLLEARKNGRWRNTQETVYSLLALRGYYRAREKEPPDFVAQVAMGQKIVLEKKFKGRSLEVQHHEVPMSKLLDFHGPLGFIKKGSGRLHYTARLRYARDTLPTTPWDEGFYVMRTYERVPQDGASSMDALRGDPAAPRKALAKKGVDKVKAGDLVRVTLRIIVPQQAHFVVVDDPLPAGLEAINFRLMTAASSLRRGADFFGYRSRHGHKRHRSPWYTPFYHREIRDDRVQLFADSVPPGVHTYVYLARATTIGKFVAAPTHVEQMYDPEVFGRTGASTFEVAAK